MTQYQKWLVNPDYSEGIALYHRLGGNDPVLCTLFKLQETSFTRKKLEQALAAIGDSDSLSPQEASITTAESKTPKPVLDLIRKRSQLHESLFHQTAPSTRHSIAVAILNIGKKLDRWYDHGEMPSDESDPQEQDIPVNAWELHQLINNNMAYMAKNRNREDKQGEVKRRDRENQRIEERLKSINYEVTGQSNQGGKSELEVAKVAPI